MMSHHLADVFRGEEDIKRQLGQLTHFRRNTFRLKIELVLKKISQLEQKKQKRILSFFLLNSE